MCATEIEIASSHSIYLLVRFTEKDIVIAIVFWCILFIFRSWFFFSSLIFVEKNLFFAVVVVCVIVLPRDVVIGINEMWRCNYSLKLRYIDVDDVRLFDVLKVF